MNGPTGLIFAMRSKYTSQGGSEAFFDEADTTFSATDSSSGTGEIGSGYVSGSEGSAVGLGTTGAGSNASNPGLLGP